MEDEKKTKKQLIEELSALRLEQIEQTKVTSEKFTKAFLQSSIPITITTVKEGRFVEVSDAFLRLVELKRDEVIGHTSTETGFITQEQRTLFYNELSKNGRVDNLEMEVTPKGRGLRYGLFNVVMMSINNKNHLLTTIQDITDRKQAEEALRESEEKYRLVANNIPDIIYSLNSEGNIVTVNSSALERYGYSEQDAKGKPYLDFVHPEDREILINSFLKAVEDKRKVTTGLQFRLVAENGVSHWFELNAYTRFDNHERYIGEDGVLRDITERKQMEEVLVKSEEKFRLITENMVDCVALVDTNGTFQYVTPSTRETLGYDPEDMIGITGYSITHPDDLEEITRLFPKDNAHSRVETNYDTRLRHKDGHYVSLDVRARTLIDQEGKRMGSVLAARDTTDRKQAEAALRESEKRFRELAELLPETVFETDIQGTLIFANKNAFDRFGYTQEDFAGGLNLLDTVTAHDRGRALEGSQRIMNRGNIGSNEYTMQRKDGNTFPATIHSAAIIQDGKPVGLRGLVIDITNRKQAETEKAALEAQNRQLQKSESLGRMAASIAHHFNNQLGAVIGNLEMAMDELPKGASTHQTLTKAMKSAWTAADMSGLMLTYLGQTHEKVEPLDLSYTCRKILPLIETTLPGNVAMETDFPLPIPIIMANAGEIQQILNNLITNSREAIGNNKGNISLSVKTVSPAEIPTAHRHPVDWQQRDKAYACLQVADTGSGIEIKDIEKLFDPFFTDKFTGRGMGLPVVLGIVKSLKGAITVDSNPGKGSTFRIFFPVSEEARLQPQTAESGRDVTISSPSPKKMEEGGTVLVVEDEEMLRDMAAAMLESFGFTVLKAKDGIEALEIFGKHQNEIKFVLSDLTMPRMGGWETLTALRKLKPNIPVILASGYDLAHVMEGVHPELPQTFLAKPYNLAALRAAITQTLARKK